MCSEPTSRTTPRPQDPGADADGPRAVTAPEGGGVIGPTSAIVTPGGVRAEIGDLDRERHARSGFVGRPGRRGRPSLGAHVTPVDRAMMERALVLAEQAADMGEVPVGAVVYRGSEIVAEGFNLRERTSDPVAHAELLAISEAGRRLGEWRLTDCSLAVTLEPCVMCAGAMVNARVGRLVYGATDPKAGACESLYRIPVDTRLNHEVEVVTGLLADQASEQLRSFFRRRREENRRKRQAEKRAADPRAGRPGRGASAGGGGARPGRAGGGVVRRSA